MFGTFQRAQWRNRSRKEKGVAIIMLTLGISFFLPMVGLAIDTGVLYVVRAKMQAAVDAGALAGARSLSRGLDLVSQEAAARQTAENFFAANFPDDIWGASGIQVQTTIWESAYRTRSVRLAASADVPVYFMHILGVQEVAVHSEGTASRRDVNVMMVLDRSGSLATAGACGDLRAAALSFVDKFASGRDRLGMITYGAGSRVDYAPGYTFKTGATNLNTLIPQINCAGYTASAQALWQGYQQLALLNEPGALNILLFFTDGVPNTITARFTLRRGSSQSHCYDYVNSKSYSQTGWNPAPLYGAAAPGYGLYNPLAPALPSSGDVRADNSNGCYFYSNYNNVEQDIYYANDEVRYNAGQGNRDFHGNRLDTGYKSVTKNSGRVRLTSGNMPNVAVNALDDAASRVRNDANIGAVVYAIGLGGAGEAEHTLLQRVANDLSSPIHSSAAPTGQYVYAPSAAQLNDAFSRIASEILRIAK